MCEIPWEGGQAFVAVFCTEHCFSCPPTLPLLRHHAAYPDAVLLCFNLPHASKEHLIRKHA